MIRHDEAWLEPTQDRERDNTAVRGIAIGFLISACMWIGFWALGRLGGVW